MNEWISVEDRLPAQKGGYVVAIGMAKYGSTRTSTIGYWTGREWERGHEASGYQSHEPTFEDYDMFVTDWMPLPDPPEK